MPELGFWGDPVTTKEPEKEKKPTQQVGFWGDPVAAEKPAPTPPAAPIFTAPDPAEFKAAQISALTAPPPRLARPGRPYDIVRPGAEAALTGLGAIGTGLDIAFTRPVKTAGRFVGEALTTPFLGSAQPDVSGIAPERQEEAREIAATARERQGPPAPFSLSEAWAKSAQPQWETMAEVRKGKAKAEPGAWDYLVGVPAEFMTDWSLILGIGLATKAAEGGKVALRIKPAMLEQLSGMISRRAPEGGKWAKMAKWLGRVGAERKVTLPGKVSEKVGRYATGLRAATRAEPAVKPKAGLARLAFEAGAEPTAARVAEEAFEGTEKAMRQVSPGFWKRTGIDLTDVEKVRATEAAEYFPRFMAGDKDAAVKMRQLVGGNDDIERAAAAIYKGETAVTAARKAGGIPDPSMTAATERKLEAAQRKLAGYTTDVKAGIRAKRGAKTVRFIEAEKAAKEAAEQARQARATELTKLTAQKERAELKLGRRVKGRAQKVWDAEAGKYVEAVGAFPPQPSVAAEPLAAFEKAVDPALAAERAAKAVEEGAPLAAIKVDLYRAFGKEGYAQALHDAKTVGQLRARMRILQRQTTSRAAKRQLAKIEQGFSKRWGKLDIAFEAAEKQRLARMRGTKKYQRTRKQILGLFEAKEKAPAHITRNLTREGRAWLSDASMRTKPEAVSRPIHSLSGSTLERTFADPKTGRSMYLDEINEMLEQTLVDSSFAKKHPTWAAIAKKADAKRGPVGLRQTIGGKEKMPLVSHVFETDPHKILDTSINRAIMDAEQSGFVRELGKLGSKEKQRGWAHVKKLVSKDRPNPAMKELVDQIGDVYFPPEVMDELKRTVTNLTDASAQKRIVKMYDKALGAWKYSVTAPFPAFHARNVTSNMVMIVGNGVRAESPIILDSTRYITGKGFVKLGRTTMPAKQFARKMKAWKISGGLGREVAGVLGATDEAFRGGYAADRLREAMTKWGDELTPKHWQFARDQVNKTLGNYRDIGKTGKFLQRTALPFWKWTRHSVPQHVEWLFTKPYMLNAEAKAEKLTGGWLKRRAGTILGTGNPLEDTADFVDMAKDIVSGKGADAWRKGAWRFTPPVANVGLAIKNFVQGGKPVRAPRGAEYMPDSWRRVFGIREVDGQIVMPSYRKDIAKLLRVFNEVRKHYSQENSTEAWVRTITGIGRSDASQSEDDLGRLYDDLDEIMKSLRAKQLTKPGYAGREAPAKAARREPEHRDYLKVQRDLKRVRAILKRERAARRQARPLPQSAPRRPLPR